MEAKAQIEMVARIAAAVPLEAAERLVDEYRRVEALVPIFDPTSWQRVQRYAGDHAKLARAFLAFRTTIGELTTELT